ncbi:MAG TPA: hypothetical protein PLU53_09820 [Bacteroidia bacterium]|nr:hypothetical protein [Bacteroidia bacterium]
MHIKALIRKLLSLSHLWVTAGLLFCWVKAGAASYGIQTALVRNNTVQEASEVASNVLKVANFTGRPVSFHLDFSLPAGWELLGSQDREINLNTNDSVFLPVRVIPHKLSKGGTSYIITILLVSDKGLQFAAQNWYVDIRANSQWKAFVPQKQIYFVNNVDSSGFRIRFQNLGNAEENIRVTMLPDRHLQLFSPENNQPALLSFTVPLSVGADTTLLFTVHRIADKNQFAGKKDGAGLPFSPRENFPIQLIARSTSGLNNQSWTSNVQFNRVGNRGQKNEFGHTALPLTLEANVYDVLSDGTTLALDAYGSTVFGEDRFLNYRLQSVFVTNFLDENSYLGTNHYIGYFSSRMTLEAGEVNGWGRSLLTGRGFKGSYTIGKNTVGAMIVRSPNFFRSHISEGYGFYHRLQLKNITWSNYLSQQENTALNVTNSLANTFASWKISPHHQVSAGGGYSVEKWSPLSGNGASHPGYGYDFSYTGSTRKLSFTASTMQGSSDYSLARGIQMYSTRTSYVFNPRNNLAFTTHNFRQQPSFYINGILQSGNNIRSDRYELRYGITSPGSMAAIKPMYMQEENMTLRVNTIGSGFEYSVRNSGTGKLSSTLFMGYAHLPDYDLPSFFLARVSVLARWEKFFVNVRYFFGPNQIAEQLRFVHHRINPQTVHANASYDYWFGEGKYLLTTTSNIRYETFYKKFNFRLRPELFYYTKSGFRFSVYASFFSNSQGENPLLNDLQTRAPFEKLSAQELNMGFGVKKQIGIPIPGKKFCSVRVIVFKDLNGNGKQDGNEEGVENMLVSIRLKSPPTDRPDTLSVGRDQSEDFVTDMKGQIYYDNVTPGVYLMKATPLINQGEWFDVNSVEIQIDKKNTIYLPLSRGIKLNGSVLISRDKYSTDEAILDLSRIRVTAIDSSGKTFSCLTDRDGQFSLFLPMGIYTLAINDAALGNKFVFVQNKMSIDLTHPVDNYSVTFNVAEKRRKMDIKKFNSDGELIK